jgi:putative membrane protein
MSSLAQGGENMPTILNDIRVLIISIIYAALGMVLLWIGYKVFDLVTPTDMQKKIFEEGNVAVAITVGAFILGLAVVIGAAIHG